MEPIEGSFEPNKEIDQLRWLPLADALEALTHDHDRVVVEALAATRLQHGRSAPGRSLRPGRP